jgi:hypothetical protein
MAAPIADKILLPLDTGNTGKKVRTQTRVVGADTVHEHFFIPTSLRSRLGMYYGTSGTLTIPIAVHTPATTGFFWFINPVASGRNIALRRWAAQIQFAVLTAVDVSVPRLALSLCTFTGTPSGATIAAAKRATADATPVGSIRTAMTGLTVTVGNMIKTDFPPINATASSATIQSTLGPATSNDWDPPEEEQPILVPGEGLICWAADGSTTANRRLSVDFIWEEFEP